MNAAAWRMVLAATALMALTMGTRSAFGLFLSPLNTATGIGLAGLGLAVAFGQLGLGFAQPAVGWLADRYGARRLISTGALVLAGATLSVAFAGGFFSMIVALVVIAVAGSAVGSNVLLFSEVGRVIPAQRRAIAFGLIGAGGSAGQMMLGPATQAAIEGQGWVFALSATALLCLIALPLARAFGREPRAPARAVVDGEAKDVFRQPAFWLIAASFAVCGFHIAFLTAHMPGVIERCGLPSGLAGTWLAALGAASIVGSLAAGWWLRRNPARPLVIAIFLVRAASIAALLALPASGAVMLGFALLMGLSYMSLLPAISQQLAELFGARRLGTTFGVIAFVHQLGSFAGASLGGAAAELTGSDTVFWTVDIGAALLAVAFQALLAAADNRQPVLRTVPA
jgi:predicted MFS family arabinose efflux permease